MTPRVFPHIPACLRACPGPVCTRGGQYEHSPVGTTPGRRTVRQVPVKETRLSSNPTLGPHCWPQPLVAASVLEVPGESGPQVEGVSLRTAPLQTPAAAPSQGPRHCPEQKGVAPAAEAATAVCGRQGQPRVPNATLHGALEGEGCGCWPVYHAGSAGLASALPWRAGSTGPPGNAGRPSAHAHPSVCSCWGSEKPPRNHGPSLTLNSGAQ